MLNINCLSGEILMRMMLGRIETNILKLFLETINQIREYDEDMMETSASFLQIAYHVPTEQRCLPLQTLDLVLHRILSEFGTPLGFSRSQKVVSPKNGYIIYLKLYCSHFERTHENHWNTIGS